MRDERRPKPRQGDYAECEGCPCTPVCRDCTEARRATLREMYALRPTDIRSKEEIENGQKA